MTNTNPRVFVLILSYNGIHLLDECISSYLSNDYANYELVVIDNGSSDGSKDYIERKWSNVFVLRTNVNLGYSGGMNFGLDFAFHERNADFALVTNNDVLVDKGLIKALVNTASNYDNVGFVTGKVYFYDKKNVFQTCGKYYDSTFWRGKNIGKYEVDNGQYDEEIELQWCDDIYWLINKNLYFQTGGYDTEFRFESEDFDWQVRAKNAGYKIYYSPLAKLWHKDSMTIGKNSAFKAYYDFRNPLIVHFKYRNYNEYKYYYKLKRNNLFKFSLKLIIHLKFYYLLKCWQGFMSAISWGYKNDKISFSEIFI